MNIEIHNAALEARIQKLLQTTSSGNVEDFYLDQGGTAPLLRAYAIDCPRCSC